MEWIGIGLIVAALLLQIVILVKLAAPRQGHGEEILRQLRAQQEQTQQSMRDLRADFCSQLDRLRDSLLLLMAESKESQGQKMTALMESNSDALYQVRNKLDERLDKLQQEMRSSLLQLQQGNEQKLEEMRRTVDEKLEKTLSTRLQQSFETVSKQLDSVNQGLGEMRSVAESVGSLNKVLSNTKTRGILGEIQLAQIVEDMLPPSLYDTEVPTKKGSRDRVEYAVKLPGSDPDHHVYLPIDAKFPLEDYYLLEEGYEKSDAAQIETARKALFQRLKGFGRDVKNKYVSPPETTNFAILFLPTEGLYSEVVRNPAFCEEQRKGGILIAGPTTLAALLNSLQVGFKTLQIQRSAADIETTLGAVKKEFEKFETVLTQTQKKIHEAGNEIETLVGTRTRAINRSLRNVQVYDGDLLRDDLSNDPPLY